MQQFPESSATTKTVVQSRNLPGVYFTFCNCKLSEIQFVIAGGFAKFTQLVSLETPAQGDPAIRITHHPVMSLIVARWVDRDEAVELIFQDEPLNKPSIGQSFIDLKLSKLCHQISR